MYEQIDGNLACRDLRCSGCAGSRSLLVPLHGVQNRLRYPNLALCTSTWALYAQHEANLGHFGTILGPMLAHVGLTFGSSAACLLVLRFSAFWAVHLDSCLLLLCLLCFPLYTGAHAKNTVKYSVFQGFARFVCKARLLNPC